MRSYFIDNGRSQVYMITSHKQKGKPEKRKKTNFLQATNYYGGGD